MTHVASVLMEAATIPMVAPRAASAARPDAPFRAEVIQPIDLSKDQIDAWSSMRAANAAFDNPLLSVEFAQAVGRRRPDTRVAILYAHGAIAGFLPFQMRPGGFARPVGAPFSDFHALITAGPVDFPVLDALRAAGIKTFKAGCLIDPFNVFAQSPLTPMLCARLDVPADPSVTMDRLMQNSAQRFKRMKRLERKISREVGDVTMTIGDQDEAAFDQIMSWKSAQYEAAGLHDVLQPDWARGLMCDLFKTNSGKLQGCVLSLRAGGKLVAGEFGIREGENLHPWIASYDPDSALYSTGTMLRFLLIDEMPKAGLRSYDMGPSLESYKAFFQTGERTAFEGWVVPPRAPTSEKLIGAIPNERVRGVVARIVNRIDHIASAEITTTGRAKGFVSALRGMRSRLEAGAHVEAPETAKD